MLDKGLSHTTSDGSKPDIKIVTLDGPLVLSNMFDLQNYMRSLRPPCLILDLTMVPYMDSAGLGVLMNCFVSAQGSGRKMIVVGANERLRALFEMTKVESVLTLCDSVSDAEAMA